MILPPGLSSLQLDHDLIINYEISQARNSPLLLGKSLVQDPQAIMIMMPVEDTSTGIVEVQASVTVSMLEWHRDMKSRK